VQLSPRTSPSARDSMASAYDGATRQFIMYGGETAAGAPLSDTWSWTGSTWTQLHPKARPPALAGEVMAYDAAKRQLLLFGGLNVDGTVQTSTWLWTGSIWQALKTSASPSGGLEPSLAWDAASNQLVLFGGITGTQTVEDQTWTWTGTNWQLAAPATSPPGLGGASMAYYPPTQNLILFGGTENYGVANLDTSNETWAWSGTNWVKQSPATVPASRFAATFAYDAASFQMILIGGAADVGGTLVTYSGTWTWSGGTWNEKAPATVPEHRAVATMTFDGATNQFVLFGGSPEPGQDFSGTWLWERQP
jgi:hypothetical protein